MTYNNEHVTEIPVKEKKKIISYICFETAEAFEQWQIDNQDTKIITVMPAVAGLNFTVDEDQQNTSGRATTIASTFVVYWK